MKRELKEELGNISKHSKSSGGIKCDVWRLYNNSGYKVAHLVLEESISTPDNVQLKQIHIDPSYRRQGVGTYLVQAVKDEYLNVSLDALTPYAQDFYNSIGFIVEAMVSGEATMSYSKEDDIVELLSSYDNLEDATRDISFHGTVEPIIGDLRGGGYDGILWTARTPDIAQTYIPTSGSSVLYSKPSSYDMNKSMSMYYSDSQEIKLAKELGYEFDIETKKGFTRIVSYSIKKDGEHCEIPTNQDIFNLLSEKMGYFQNDETQEHLQCGYTDYGVHEYRSKIYKEKGRLYILKGIRDLKLFDMSTGEGDLMSVQYHNLDDFERLRNEGYDGVIIDDFAQNDRYGNVGHESVGLFPSGIKKVEMIHIPAYAHDWGSTEELRQTRSTSEFNMNLLFEKSRKIKQKDYKVKKTLNEWYSAMTEEDKCEVVFSLSGTIRNRAQIISEAIRVETNIENLAQHQEPIIEHFYANLSFAQEQKIKDHGDGNVYRGDTYTGQTIFGVVDKLQPIEEYISEIKESDEYKYFVDNVSSLSENKYLVTDPIYHNFLSKVKTLEDFKSVAFDYMNMKRNTLKIEYECGLDFDDAAEIIDTLSMDYEVINEGKIIHVEVFLRDDTKLGDVLYDEISGHYAFAVTEDKTLGERLSNVNEVLSEVGEVMIGNGSVEERIVAMEAIELTEENSNNDNMYIHKEELNNTAERLDQEQHEEAPPINPTL